MTFQKNHITVHFSAYSITNYGQTVCITGNCHQLGNWDPNKGFKLQTNPKQYPIWFSKNPIILQKFTTIQFKLCVLGSDGNVIRWQNLKFNRTLYFKTSCSVFLTEGQSQAEYEQQIEDTASTKINSAKKEDLSSIQEQSDEDESNKENISLDAISEQRKRSGSSDRSSNNSQEILQLKTYSDKNIEIKTLKNQ